MNDPAGSTPEPQHGDPDTGPSDTAASPGGRDRSDGRAGETEACDTRRPPRAEPPSRLPEGYEPL